MTYIYLLIGIIAYIALVYAVIQISRANELWRDDE